MIISSNILNNRRPFLDARQEKQFKLLALKRCLVQNAASKKSRLEINSCKSMMRRSNFK